MVDFMFTLPGVDSLLTGWCSAKMATEVLSLGPGILQLCAVGRVRCQVMGYDRGLSERHLPQLRGLSQTGAVK